jgi:predicted GTPase
MNCLLKEERSLATPLAGTTQEPVLGQAKLSQVNFQLVDTAGITKQQTLSKKI